MGPAGGLLHHPDGDLLVPAGALATTTTLTLTSRRAPADTALGGVPLGRRLSAQPAGQTFLVPVKLRLPFDPTMLPTGTAQSSVVVRMGEPLTDAFVALASVVDSEAKTVTAKVTRLADFVPTADPSPLFLTTSLALPTATLGQPYSTPLTATGGVAPYTWTAALGALLPPGLSVVPTGAITGTPSATGQYAFYVTAADSGGRRVQSVFTVNVVPGTNPSPTLTSMSPTSSGPASPDLTLTVSGSGFVPSSRVAWDGVDLPTTFVSSSVLAASVDAQKLAEGGEHTVTVVSPAPGGGRSNGLPFSSTAPPSPPYVTGINPGRVPLSAIDVQVRIFGARFTPSSVVTLGTTQIPTAYLTPTELDAVVPASYLTKIGSLLLSVYDPPPGGSGYSNQHCFLVGNQAGNTALLDKSSPRWISAGSGDVVLELTGSRMAPGVTAYFGPYALATTVLDDSTANATIPAALLASPGAYGINSVTPGAGCGDMPSTQNRLHVNTGPKVWRQLSTASLLSCGIVDDGRVYCWGPVSGGGLGNGSLEYVGYNFDMAPGIRMVPTIAAGGGSFDQVSAHYEHVCGIVDGDLYCWGTDGAGTVDTRPTQRFPGLKFSSVETGRWNDCALSTTGALRCWGGDWGPAGAASNVVPGTFKAFSVGFGDLICTLDAAGAAACIGTDSVGMGSTAGFTFASIRAGFKSACGITAAGQLYCWTNGTSANVTWVNGTPTTPEPVALAAGVSVVELNHSWPRACLLSSAGTVYCSVNGQGPVVIAQEMGLPPLKHLAEDCGLTASGERWCWAGLYPGDAPTTARIDRATRMP